MTLFDLFAQAFLVQFSNHGFSSHPFSVINVVAIISTRGGGIMKTKIVQRIGFTALIISLSAMVSFSPASATTLQMTSQNYWYDQNIDEPWGGDAWNGGYWSPLMSSDSYQFDAYAYAQGRMYCYFMDYI
jgi:hypothetical protein